MLSFQKTLIPLAKILPTDYPHSRDFIIYVRIDHVIPHLQNSARSITPADVCSQLPLIKHRNTMRITDETWGDFPVSVYATVMGIWTIVGSDFFVIGCVVWMLSLSVS